MGRSDTTEFAERLRAVMTRLGVGVLELARKAKVGRNTVGRHLNPTGKARPPSPRIRRRYETALKLPPMALDSGVPSEVVGLIGRNGELASSDGHGLDEPFAFIRSQLEGYRRTGRLVAVQVVDVWLAELEAAALSRRVTAVSPEV